MAQTSNSAVIGGTVGTHLDTSSMTMQMEKPSGIPCRNSAYDDFLTGERVRQTVFDDVIMVEERTSGFNPNTFNHHRKVSLHIKAFDAPIQIALFDSEEDGRMTIGEAYHQRAIAEKLRDYAVEQLAKLELEK